MSAMAWVVIIGMLLCSVAYIFWGVPKVVPGLVEQVRANRPLPPWEPPLPRRGVQPPWERAPLSERERAALADAERTWRMPAREPANEDGGRPS